MATSAQVIDVIFRGRNDADAALRGVEQGLAKVDQAGEGVSKVGTTLDGIGSRLGTLGPLLAGAFGAVSVGAFVTQFVAANVEVEKFLKAVAQIKGNGTLAGQELDYLRSVADRLGLSVRDTAGAYVSLLAATKGTALEGQQTRVIFESVASAMSLLGSTSADTEGALLAIQQMISKGVVNAEELRGQLASRLPGALQIAARAVGTTTEELGKMLEAGQLLTADFLPKFAAELNKSFGNPGQIDTYSAAMNRLKNQVDETLQALGNTGLFDALTSGLGGSTKAVEATSAGITYLASVAGAAFDVLRGGSLDVFSAQLKLAGERADDVAVKLSSSLNQALAETERLTRQAAEATTSFNNESEAETARLKRQASAQADALKEVGEALKTLGVSPEKVQADVSKVLDAFDSLTKGPNVSGGQLLAGLESVLKSIDDKKYLPRLKDQLQEAWAQGRITSDELAKGMGLVAKEQEDLDKKLGITTQSIADQAKEAQNAKEAAEKLALEMEKLASNERIKTMEFRANLNIENIKAQTERIKDAFQSLDNTVNSTADVINKAFGLLAGGSDLIDSSVRNKLFEQVDRENQNRQDALRMQRDLTTAQIKVLEAQAKQLQGGDTLIKVDGSGLKPHLEAFMWEIVRAIQVRTNADGLRLLLGVA